jgi:hypothetical protein
MQKKSGPAVARFTRKDAGFLAAAGVALVIISGTCWHFASESRVEFRDYDGVVVSKVLTLPPGKQMYPVRRSLVIDQKNGTRETVAVNEAVYQRARPGMKFHRDRFGNASLDE